MTDLKVEEVLIPLYNNMKIAGKFWGDKSLPTILCLHGQGDNCGSFDLLIPLLPREFSYIAIDLPGHGLSSRLPDGIFYTEFDYLVVINQVIDFYAWKSVGIIGHSMSARLTFIYASIFPNRVNMAIAIDVLKPLDLEFHELRGVIGFFRYMTVDNARNLSGKEPPAVEYDELVERLHRGSIESVTKEVANHLLDRNIKRSKNDPQKFYFSKDRRLMSGIPAFLPQTVQLELAKRIKIPYLYIYGKDSFYQKGLQTNYDNEVIEIMKKNPNFEICVVDSKSHHFHLSEAEKFAKYFSDFILKHKNVKSQL